MVHKPWMSHSRAIWVFCRTPKSLMLSRMFWLSPSEGMWTITRLDFLIRSQAAENFCNPNKCQALCHFNDATGSLIQMRSVLGVQDSNKSFVEKFLLAQWLKFVKSFQLYGHHFFFCIAKLWDRWWWWNWSWTRISERPNTLKYLDGVINYLTMKYSIPPVGEAKRKFLKSWLFSLAHKIPNYIHFQRGKVYLCSLLEVFKLYCPGLS